jgi:hypothetical protein
MLIYLRGCYSRARRAPTVDIHIVDMFSGVIVAKCPRNSNLCSITWKWRVVESFGIGYTDNDR